MTGFSVIFRLRISAVDIPIEDSDFSQPPNDVYLLLAAKQLERAAP
jgi:hypothetical protein